MKRLKKIGPAAMVAAAFIGPGTITTATLAGAGFGYTLLWAVLFSILTTILLQEMSARLGLVARLGLGQAIREKMTGKVSRYLAIGLVLSSILVGNAAYEAGNISGAVLGFENLNGFANLRFNPLIFVIAFVAFILLYIGRFKIIENFLVILVGLMSLIFVVTAILVQPDFSSIISGMLKPAIPENSLIMIVGLIGTTVVPYNLFLHSSSVQEKWSGAEDLPDSRMDTIVSVIVGGLITIAIVVSSAAVLHGSGKEVNDATALAYQLTPLLGSWADDFIAFGFLAAGLSSTITAPLAAAYASSGILGWRQNLRSFHFRMVWGLVLCAGVMFSLSGFKPISIILFAQAANGILLPVVVIFLLIVMNDKKLLNDYVNSRIANVFGILVVAIALLLGFKSIFSVFEVLT